MTKKKLHFIAIGGAAMHNLALALHQNVNIISGSDDEINEPSRTRLKEAGLLPAQEGWYPEKLNNSIDGVILGMHARADNPELLKAQELGLKIYSYPEYLYLHSQNKKRVVIGGSHGKTTITSMVLHVLKIYNYDFDYMVGAKLEGFDTMVRISDAPLIILEGDEYLSSPIDRRPKFHLYQAEIGLISGIAWDHINVFPTYDMYVDQFRIFADNIPATGKLIYCNEDPEVKSVAESKSVSAERISYGIPKHEIKNGVTFLLTDFGKVELSVFGKHNLMNLEGARNICEAIGVSRENFYKAISNFKGAARRLELLAKNEDVTVYKDFAHSPSKLKATTTAVREQFTGRKLIACIELHTFSSLNAEFLREYKNCIDDADVAIIYYNPHTIEHKKLKPISKDQVKEAFGRNDLIIYNDSTELKNYLLSLSPKNSVYLLMSSGTFDGIDLNKLAIEITEKNTAVI